MKRVRFKTVDVFTTTPFKGNPLAVILDAGGISTEQMQKIANWTNLSETTFVVPVTADGADYQVRIFTPGSELPFAGHPTIGTAHALLEAGMVEAKNGTLIQQCGAGLIRLTVEYANDGVRWISFDLPEPKFTPLNGIQVQELKEILGTSLEKDKLPYLVDVGARWIVAQLPDAKTVLDLKPDLQRMKLQDSKGKHTGVVVFGKKTGDAAKIEVRAFAPAQGINEDPVCGSGNGSVAAYIRHTGQTEAFGKNFLATQGVVVGRAGTLKLSITDKVIQVGGNAITCVDGTLSF